ncbi:DUF1295 domain-containing protein [Herpetosiphon geysericola]|uniref:Membrane protein n=1 Tax=Herpetosiphon geysericola TaxID=70996 RepID=A0A0P6YEF9_9CHLR|nr:DUF1295 domain-containing protein [Herpetosiphon geysericola]KPL90531.1 membrane protein [Herpetosiphon geysericola]
MSFWLIWGLGLAVVMVPLTLAWLWSVKITNASIVDICWGMCFVALTWWYFSQAQGDEQRKLIISSLVTIWGLRLTLYIGWRNWGKPEDFRYAEFRQRYGAERYWWFSFFQVFLLQGILALIISVTLLGAQTGAKSWNWIDYLALVVWLIGFSFEAFGDWQLSRFKANPANKGQVLRSGLWRFTRHPNYFGDSAVWWGYALFAIAAGSYWHIIGALLMTLLIIRVSGVMLLERTLVKTKPQYADYIAKTSAFLPWFPKS